jgi:sugar-phosphatase
MRLAIFDVDGTLLDLPVEIERARKEIAAMFRIRGFKEPMRPILAQIQRAAAAVARGDAERNDLIRQAFHLLDDYEVEGAERVSARPGAAMVDALAVADHPVALVTDNGRKAVEVALRSAGLPALAARAVLVTRDDVAHGKPAPDGLLLAISKLRHGECDVVYAGDSPRDMEAAVAAERQIAPRRIYRVGICADDAEKRARLLTVGAEEVVADVGAVMPLLRTEHQGSGLHE